MTVAELLQQIDRIRLPAEPKPVEATCRDVIIRRFGVEKVDAITVLEDQPRPGWTLAVHDHRLDIPPRIRSQLPQAGPWGFVHANPSGTVELIASSESLLYAYLLYFIDDLASKPVSVFSQGLVLRPAFHWHRPLFDNFLTQTWRMARQVHPESHIRAMARAGYTHVEVNALAQTAPLEPGVPGEFYAPFYTYGAALDQFIASDLNRGVYPADYLAANLSRLKANAQIAKKYGLKPGLLCFEPRSVPESFFARYPTLRGARVDHPFRSRKPRYSLALAHPLVQEHYRQLIRRLLEAVPELCYLSLWSNDSGAGFEFTASLYVGRNGGPYLIREWHTHEQIAEAAGKNVVSFMQLLQQAAAEINPEFRVSLRLEPFQEEHDVIISHLQPKLDIEAPSLLVRGYELPYSHPHYDDVRGVAGSVFHVRLEPEEQTHLKRFTDRGIHAHLIYSQGNAFNFEPLIGIPFPWLILEKLRAMRNAGFTHVANLGGTAPSSLAPYPINQEVFRAFQLDPDGDLDGVLQHRAGDWAPDAPEAALQLWRFTDNAVRWIPILPLYSHFGFVWLRTWVRPIVPDLQAIPEADRRYYEDFMVSPANNTNLADLSRDVLFQLFTPGDGRKFVERTDTQAMPRIQTAIEFSERLLHQTSLTDQSRSFFRDQRDRLVALSCWLGTQRATAAWTAGVYGYLEARTRKEQKFWRGYLDDMMEKEIHNTQRLLELWRTSETPFMAVSAEGETPFLYGENFGELLERKIELMQNYRNVAPRIDRDIIWRL